MIFSLRQQGITSFIVVDFRPSGENPIKKDKVPRNAWC
jgi:hypothetical protein